MNVWLYKKMLARPLFFLSLLLRLLRTPFPIHLHQKDPSSYSSDVLKYMQEEGEDAPPKAQSSFVYLYS